MTAGPFLPLAGGRRLLRAPVNLLLGFILLASGCDSPTPDTSPVTGDGSRPSDAVAPQGVAETDPDLLNCPITFRARREGTGLAAVHCSGISDERYFPAVNGSGLAASDIDGDGWMDLILVTGCPIPVPRESSQHLTTIYRNHGQWQFRDATSVAGGQFDGYVAGITAADFDNDGFNDLYLNCLGENRLYRNLGDGTFDIVTGDGRPSAPGFGTSSAFADLDNDGSLDLFVCNYGDWSPETNKWCGDRARNIRAFCAPDQIEPTIDTIYRSNGDGTFTDMTTHSVVQDRNFRSQGVIATHLNADDAIDLYVGNDAHPNCLYLNTGDFTFDEVAQTTGAAFDRNGAMQASMGIAAADFDRNASVDLFVTNYSREHNALYRGLGNGMFFDEARATGVMDGAMPLVGWGVGFADLDCDGWEDLVVVNGHTDGNLQLIGEESDYEQPTLVYHNDHGRFRLLNSCIENEQESLGSSRGMALLDADGDADVDVVFLNQDALPGVLENTTPPRDACVTLQLVGCVGNRNAIGARISTNEQPPLVRIVQGGGSYLSTSAPQVLLPVPIDADATISVRWPSGVSSTLTGLKPGGSYVVREPRDAGDDCRAFRLPEMASF